MLPKEIKIGVLKLNVIDRLKLVEILLESLNKTDEEIEKIWIAESENRYRAYKEGRINGISLDDVHSGIAF
jgi:putative addiction module component (TIGR02574 family)